MDGKTIAGAFGRTKVFPVERLEPTTGVAGTAALERRPGLGFYKGKADREHLRYGASLSSPVPMLACKQSVFVDLPSGAT